MNNKSQNNRSPKPKTSTQLLQTKFTKNNIIIAVRVRPLNASELEYSNFKTLTHQSNEQISFHGIDSLSSSPEGTIYIGDETNIVITKYRKKDFEFDFAFEETTTQDEVYKNTTKMLLDNIMNGFNSTVFAYGATGSGKTYTMVGTDSNPGLMVKSIQDLFAKVNEQQTADKNFTIKFSYVEVYNETLKDLLVETSAQTLDIRDSPDKGTVIVGATVIEVTDENYAFELLKNGNKRRREKPTVYNKNSSRSHAILQINVEVEGKSYYDNNINELTFGKFIMVDLAGSERVTAGAKRDKDSESGSINKSLLALSKCIASLVSNKSKHIPYRESKLTRMLKDSLCGNSRIVMIATVSPSLINKDETLFTLQYANKAKNIKVNVTKNVIEQKPQVNKYEEIIRGLNVELNELKRQMKGNIASVGVAPVITNVLNNETDDKEYKQLQEMIIKHFEKEKKIKMEIISKEKEIDNIKNEMVLNNNNNDNDESNKMRINELKKEINNLYADEQTLLKDRKQINTLIIKNIQTYGKHLYNIYNYYIAYLNYIISEHRKDMNNSELVRKDETIKILLEQLQLRDQRIITAGKTIQKYNGDLNYKNNQFRSSEEIAIDPCELPVINLPKRKHNIQLVSKSANDSNINDSHVNKTSDDVLQNENNGSYNKELQLLNPVVSNERQYNYEMLKFLSRNKSANNKNLLNQYKKHKLVVYNDSHNTDNNNTNNHYQYTLDQSPNKVLPINRKGRLNNFIRNLNNSKNILNNYKQYNNNNNNNYNNVRRQLSAKTHHSPTSPNRTTDHNNTSIGIFENEIEKKVKYILNKNIVGRYRKSPYLNMFN